MDPVLETNLMGHGSWQAWQLWHKESRRLTFPVRFGEDLRNGLQVLCIEEGNLIHLDLPALHNY